MFTLFPFRRKRSDPTKRKSRRPGADLVINRVDLSELTPPIGEFLGQAAYLQLAFFETLSRAVASAPSTRSKSIVSKVAGIVLSRHQRLVTEIERRNEQPSVVMEPFAQTIGEFQRVTLGGDWYETLVGYYVVSGILDDGFVSLAQGLPDDYGSMVQELLSNEEPHGLIAGELRDAIDSNPRLESRLALWGRRLVGDALLMTRSALEFPRGTASGDPDQEAPASPVRPGSAPAASTPAEQALTEPIFTELIAAHTRRMDELGLTA